MDYSGDTIIFGSPNKNNAKGRADVYKFRSGEYIQMGSSIGGLRETSAEDSTSTESDKSNVGDNF